MAASDFEVTGADDFVRLSKALKRAGQVELRKQLHKDLQQAVKPLIPILRAEARERLPKRGGLAARVAKTPMRVQVRTGANGAGVRIAVGKSNSGARATNRGVVRHPIFWHPPLIPRYVTQEIPEAEGWFDDTCLKYQPQFRSAIERAMNATFDQVRREGF